MSKDSVEWIKSQHTVVIVHEAGQVRIGRWVPGPNGMMRGLTWNNGSDLESALAGARGLDNSTKAVVPSV